uniref:Uncharacterized protein n=1 Tax=Panagrolaimus superbus TaxID=310955 RepID=A0A914Y0L2_9BILA
MGNPFSKRGIITKIVEAVPGGGLITSPIHALAGNPREAAQAAIGGLTSATSAIAGAAATGGIGVTATMLGILTNAAREALIDELKVTPEKKKTITANMKSGNYNKAAEILLNDGSEKLAANSRQLSAESGGQRCLKTEHDTYLRAYDSEWKVDQANGPPKAWENWYVEDWKGKVVFKAIHSPGRFLRAHPNGVVDLVDRPQAWEIWTPFKNDDDSWSFLSVHGQWLSAQGDGKVCTMEKCLSSERFWLERW